MKPYTREVATVSKAPKKGGRENEVCGKKGGLMKVARGGETGPGHKSRGE